MKTIIDDKILRLQKDILKRYEDNLQDGLMVLYNTKSEEMWLGNASSRDLIKIINSKRTIKEIFDILLHEYSDYESTEVINSFNIIIQELLAKNFIETIEK